MGLQTNGRHGDSDANGTVTLRNAPTDLLSFGDKLGSRTYHPLLPDQA